MTMRIIEVVGVHSYKKVPLNVHKIFSCILYFVFHDMVFVICYCYYYLLFSFLIFIHIQIDIKNYTGQGVMYGWLPVTLSATLAIQFDGLVWLQKYLGFVVSTVDKLILSLGISDLFYTFTSYALDLYSFCIYQSTLVMSTSIWCIICSMVVVGWIKPLYLSGACS